MNSHSNTADPLNGLRGQVLALSLAAGALLTGWPTQLAAQTDDWNDGDDVGWTQYDPRAGLGMRPQASFNFTNGAYRIFTPIDPGVNFGGPGRAGLVREDVTYTDFYVSVDVIDWDDTTHQAFGLLARVTTPGLQTLDGYAFTYERGSGVTPTSGDTDLSVIDNEAPDGLTTGNSAYHLDPAKDYRFVFIGKGPILEGRIYELPDIITPVLTITAQDDSYSQGWCGLVTYDLTGGEGVTDCTFDNYFASRVEPPRLFVDYNLDFDEVVVSWVPSSPPFRLQTTTSLDPTITWTDVNENQIFTSGDRLQYTIGPEDALRVFRLFQD